MDPLHHGEQLHTYEASEADKLSARPGADEEQMVPRRQRPPDEGDIDFTPMIDMTFLLLIFFLLTFKTETPGEFKLPKAQYGRSAVVKDSVIITVAEGPEKAASIFKGDGIKVQDRLKAENQEDQEEELMAYIEEGLSKDNKHLVLIKASKGVRHRDVARVAQASGKVEGVQAINVAVLEVPPQ